VILCSAVIPGGTANATSLSHTPQAGSAGSDCAHRSQREHAKGSPVMVNPPAHPRVKRRTKNAQRHRQLSLSR
jgi:hypothetical protein